MTNRPLSRAETARVLNRLMGMDLSQNPMRLLRDALVAEGHEVDEEAFDEAAAFCDAEISSRERDAEERAEFFRGD